MEFDEAFEKLTAMAAGRRCTLSYNRHSDPGFEVYPLIHCLIWKKGEYRLPFITNHHETFEAALAEMAELLARGKGE